MAPVASTATAASPLDGEQDRDGAPVRGGSQDRELVQVRGGREEDLPAVAAIYTHYVLNTTITFNTSVRTPAQWRDRYRSTIATGRYDLLVAERDGAVVGYVETQPFRPKPAYDPSVEVTVYVAPDVPGSGVGTLLYETLFQRLDGRDLHRVYAVIALPNPRSEAFHRKLGFAHRGTLTEAGRKFGRYLDVAFYERALPVGRAIDAAGRRGRAARPADRGAPAAGRSEP